MGYAKDPTTVASWGNCNKYLWPSMTISVRVPSTSSSNAVRASSAPDEFVPAATRDEARTNLCRRCLGNICCLGALKAAPLDDLMAHAAAMISSRKERVIYL